jgi:hypothetical protein
VSSELPRRPRLVIDNPSDLITDYMNLTDKDDTPDLYRRWSAIALVAGAMERRVWTRVGSRGGQPRLTYPNLYTLLIGPPGVGKYTIEDIRDLWSAVNEPNTNKQAFKVAPSNLTKASLVDRLSKSTQVRLPPHGPPLEYNSLLVAAEEFGIFLPAYDLEFIGVLNGVYNNPTVYSEERRHGPSREIAIPFPQLNILGGVQPGWLASVFPEEAWSMGLTSRMLMIYSSEGHKHDLFQEGQDHPISRARIIARLATISQLYGELDWTPEAQDRINSWHAADGPPTPQHSKLEHYCRRRSLHAIKLAVTSPVSRTGTIASIELVDIERAIAWLIEAEAKVPDVFRAMIGKSDHQVIEELYNYLMASYTTAKQNPIHESKLFMFLSQRVPSDKVQKLLEVAERSNVLARVAGTDTYIPRARHEFAVE